MSTPITHPKVDVVVLGLGHCGGPVAAELSTAGYSVVGIERGPFWNYAVDWAPENIHDEWAIAVERKFDQPLPIATFTIRNNSNQFALPVRKYTKLVQYHAAGWGVGGVGAHWGGGLGRFGPWAFQALTRTINSPGLSVLPSNHDLEDWPITYDQAVPYYNAWEQAIGVTGTNQDPFIPNATFPMPPHPDTPVGTLFKNTATSMGYHPFPTPTGLISGPYTNQYGIPRNGCIYCGWCGGLCNYVCEVGAKSSSHVTTVPAALNTGKFDLRTFSTVYRIDLDNTGTTATGVRYYDAQGNTHIQPAAVVFNGIWGFNLTRLMLLSGVGNSWKQYDPVTVTGTIGRGLTNGYAPSVTSVRGTLNMGGNAYSSGNAAGGGYEIMDFADDNFDHTGQNFIGGAPISFGGYLGSGPNMLQTHLPSRTAFGSTWKASLKDEKLPSKLTLSFGTAGTEIPTKDWYIGLDPHYKDIYGDPLARITLDWGPNRWRPADYIAPIAANILQQMGCTNITTTNVPELSQHVDWWGHHMRGGCRMGANPATSAFNKWLQSWDVQNVFAASEICDTFGDNTTAGTHVAGMLSYLAADGIKKYLATPGQLA